MAAGWIALLCVYFFWGTTYLGIRVALESVPPVLLVAIRFTISGSLMLLGARLRGDHIPSPRGKEFWRTALFGLGTLAVGNTCLSVAEQWVTGGLAALFITTSPFWMVGVDALVPGGERFHKPIIWGMLVGLAGVLLLLAPADGNGSLASTPQHVIWAFLVLQLGNLGWAAGSILQRREPSKAHPVVSGAVQQIATGLLFWIPALWLHPGGLQQITTRGWIAILYLATFGSIVGYSAYLYALDKLPVALVSTYTYVNPIVACVLGWLILNETFGWREVAAMTVIFAGVWLVRREQQRAKTVIRPVR